MLTPKIVLALAVMLVVGLFACGDSSTPTPAATPVPTAAATPTAVATAAPTPTPEPKKSGGTLKIIPIQDAKSLDGLPSNDWSSATHHMMVHDMLFGFDDNGAAQPQMVGDYNVSSDGLVYNFTLRDGLLFHDGGAVTSTDAVDSIKRWAAKSPVGNSIFKPFVTEFVTTGDSSFRITLSEPVGLLIPALANESLPLPIIMTKEDASFPISEHADGKIGSGPFRFVEWSPSVSMSHVRNDEYVPREEPVSHWAGAKIVHLDKITWHFVDDSTTKVALLATGQVDHAQNLSRDHFATLDNDDIRIIYDVKANTNQLRFNHLQPPFDNKMARQAIMLAVDQERYMRAISAEPFWRTCAAPFGCGQALESFVGSENLVAVNLDKAKQMLLDSGYDGRQVVLMGATDFPSVYNAALVTKELLENIGVDVHLTATDWTAMAERRNVKKAPEDGGWNIFHTWGPARGPLDISFLNPEWAGWYTSDAMDALKKDYLRAPDITARRAVAEKMQTIIFEDVPSVILGEHFGYSAQGVYVKGFINAQVHPFWNVKLERPD